jgi:hypothetical protein
MVCYVHRPEKPDLVVPAVKPVINEIFRQQKEQPIGEDIRDRYPMMTIAKAQDEKICASGEKVEESVEEHEINIGQCVPPGIKFPVAVMAQQDLDGDDNDIKRTADQDQYLFSKAFHAAKILQIPDLCRIHLLIGYK